MENYIGSQQHWEDNVNADYDHKKAMDKEQTDNREQPDNRQKHYKDMKKKIKEILEQTFAYNVENDKVAQELLDLFGVSNFVCPDCKGDNMVESNKREVWCNDCEKNYRENDC